MSIDDSTLDRNALFASSILDDLERQGVSEHDIRTALGWRANYRETFGEPWPEMRGEHKTGSFVKVLDTERGRGHGVGVEHEIDRQEPAPVRHHGMEWEGFSR